MWTLYRSIVFSLPVYCKFEDDSLFSLKKLTPRSSFRLLSACLIISYISISDLILEWELNNVYKNTLSGLW